MCYKATPAAAFGLVVITCVGVNLLSLKGAIVIVATLEVGVKRIKTCWASWRRYAGVVKKRKQTFAGLVPIRWTWVLAVLARAGVGIVVVTGGWGQ